MKLSLAWKSAVFPRPKRKTLSILAARILTLTGLPGDEDGVEWEIGLIFLPDKLMAKANWDCLGHQGATDVITFNYFEDAGSFPDKSLELLIGLEVAWSEGAKRHNSSYACELVLYIVHGFLHAAGYDDLTPGERAKMRRAERRIMQKLANEFDFTEIFPIPEQFLAAE